MIITEWISVKDKLPERYPVFGVNLYNNTIGILSSKFNDIDDDTEYEKYFMISGYAFFPMAMSHFSYPLDAKQWHDQMALIEENKTT